MEKIRIVSQTRVHGEVEYNDGEFATYIDPFHSGRLLTEDDCLRLARDRTGSGADSTALAPVSTRYILVRILNNLRAAYFRGKQFQCCGTMRRRMSSVVRQDRG